MVMVAVAVAVGWAVGEGQGAVVGVARGGGGGGGGGGGTLTGLLDTFLPEDGGGVCVGCVVAVGASVGVSVAAVTVLLVVRARFLVGGGSPCAATSRPVATIAKIQSAPSAAMAT